MIIKYTTVNSLTNVKQYLSVKDTVVVLGVAFVRALVQVSVVSWDLVCSFQREK